MCAPVSIDRFAAASFAVCCCCELAYLRPRAAIWQGRLAAARAEAAASIESAALTRHKPTGRAARTAASTFRPSCLIRNHGGRLFEQAVLRPPESAGPRAASRNAVAAPECQPLRSNVSIGSRNRRAHLADFDAEGAEGASLGREQLERDAELDDAAGIQHEDLVCSRTESRAHASEKEKDAPQSMTVLKRCATMSIVTPCSSSRERCVRSARADQGSWTPSPRERSAATLG